MGRKESKRFELNDQVRELLRKPDLTVEERQFIKQSYSGIGGLTRSGWDNGQFFTPEPVTRFVVSMMGIEEGRVLEPSCGSGAFFEQLPSNCEVFGIEYMQEAAAVARACYPQAQVVTGDALTQQWDEKFDYVIGNPPFGLKVDWEFGIKGNFTSEIAFIQNGLQNLKEGGILGMIIPDSILGNRRDAPFREWLMKDNKVLASVSLPGETFFHVGTSVKTSLLMIQKGREADEDYSIFMAVCEKVGWDSRGRATSSDLDEILKAYLGFRKEGLESIPSLPELFEMSESGQLMLSF
jgi:type I restriction-modification system DNA methylase subunit